MIGTNNIYTLQVKTVDQLNQAASKTIGSDCLRQAYFNTNVFSAQVIDQNMRLLISATTNTYEDTIIKAQESINQIIEG